MRRILLQYIPKGSSETMDINHSYAIIDATKKTMPVALGYMSYDDSIGCWQLYRIRTGEWVYRTMPKLMQVEVMAWVKSTMTKQYRGIQGYK